MHAMFADRYNYAVKASTVPSGSPYMIVLSVVYTSVKVAINHLQHLTCIMCSNPQFLN